MDTVLTYLKNSGRPYSANDVHNNLQKDTGLGKTAVQRALDLLVQEEKIREKTYGKQKIYFPNHETGDVSAEETEQLEARVAALAAERQELSASVRQLESKLSGLNSGKSTVELRADAKELKNECELMNQKLQVLKSGAGGVDPTVSRKLKQKHTKLVIEWRKRKRLAMDMIDAILESCPKPKKALMEEMDIETDEDAGVSIPKLP